jgi:hypothetical protein
VTDRFHLLGKLSVGVTTLVPRSLKVRKVRALYYRMVQ